MERTRKVVFLSICSGDKDLIAQWTASGDLPALDHLMRTGLVGAQTGLPGVFVGAHWPSWITGCHPGKHRVHSWRQLAPGSYETYRCNAGDHMQRPPFWRYLSEAGRRLCVLDIPHSRILPGINGLQTVEWGAHDAAYGFQASNPDLDREIRISFGLHPVSGESDGMVDLAKPLEFRDTLIRGIRMKTALTRHFYAKESWDFFAQVFTEAHCGGHLLWNHHDRGFRWDVAPPPEDRGDALKDVYVAIDRGLGEILDDLRDDATIIFTANHGMGPKYVAQHLLDRILVELGYAARKRHPPKPRSWRDVVDGPMTWGWQHLPDAMRARLTVLRDLKREIVNPTVSPPEIIEAAAGQVFTVVNNSAHGAIRVNLIGREPQGKVAPGPAYEALLESLTMDLKGLMNLETGRPIVAEIYRCDDLYPGPERRHLPDLFVQWSVDAPVNAVGSNRLPRLEGRYRYVRSGEHRPDGMFIVKGPGIAPGRIAQPVRCMDFAPTIARMLGVALPHDIDGRQIPGLGG
jgi:predicted AlkP superfamily phosphohydrolase/phosphomutase